MTVYIIYFELKNKKLRCLLEIGFLIYSFITILEIFITFRILTELLHEIYFSIWN